MKDRNDGNLVTKMNEQSRNADAAEAELHVASCKGEEYSFRLPV